MQTIDVEFKIDSVPEEGTRLDLIIPIKIRSKKEKK